MRRVREEFDNLIKIVDTMYAQKKLSLGTDYQRKIGQKLRELARRNVLTSSPAARELSELELERIKILYRYYLEQLIRLYKKSGKGWSPDFQKIAFNAVTEIIDNESSKLLIPKGVLGSAEPTLNEIVKTEVFKFKSDVKLELDKYKGLRQLELQTVPKELGGLKNDTNRADAIIAKIKNNPVIAILIVIFFIVIGIATFTESVDKIVKFARTYLPITAADRTPKVVTISSGEITLSGQGFYLIDTEGGTESDELIRINGLKKGDEVTLNAASGDRTIVVKEGHYLIMQRPVFSLDNENDFIIFRSKGGDICVEVDRKSLGD